MLQHIGQTTTFHGTIHKIRQMNGFAFVLVRTARELVQCVYSPENAAFELSALPEGGCARLTGEVVADPRSRAGYEIRLTASELVSAPAEKPPIVINNKELLVSFDNRFNYRPLTLRNARERAVFRLQEGIAHGFREHMRAEGFTEVHTPKIVSAGAEGGSSMFALDYFGKQAHLAQSPQVYKQALVGVFERVYEIGPVFRAEDHDTSRHTNEFTGLDIEMSFISSVEDVMAVQTAMLRRAMDVLRQEYQPELELLDVTPPDIGAIPRMRFSEAKSIVAESRAVTDWHDLDPEEEALISKRVRTKTGSRFVYVTHFPSSKRPFYAMDDPADPSVTLSFDLLWDGLEVSTGGQRIHDYHAQVGKMLRRGMDPGVFEHYLMAHKYGLPPHGGFGMGLERLTMQLAGLGNIRFATLFPRDTQRVAP